MKSIYSILVIGAVLFAAFATVNADSDRSRAPITLSGVTLSGQYKNRGEIMKQIQERIKAQREAMRNRHNGSGTTNTGITAEQLACVRAAVAKRESAILSASTAFATATNSGLVARAAALNTAWSITGSTERKTARQAAWTTWKNTVKAAQTTNKTARDTAWSTFRTEAQTCKVPEALTESEGGDVRMEQDWTGNHD